MEMLFLFSGFAMAFILAVATAILGYMYKERGGKIERLEGEAEHYSEELKKINVKFQEQFDKLHDLKKGSVVLLSSARIVQGIVKFDDLYGHEDFCGNKWVGKELVTKGNIVLFIEENNYKVGDKMPASA